MNLPSPLPIRRLALLTTLALVFAMACGATQTHDVRGVVRGVEAADGQILIEHEAIPGFMEAMTMSFDVADPALLDGVAVGDEIDFWLETDGSSLRVTRIRSASGAPAPAGRSGGGASFEALPRERDPAPPFSLIDQDGRRVGLDDLRGQLVVLDFVFTHCSGPCPIQTSTLVTLQRSLDDELRDRTRFVSISLDPERDSPEALRAYGTARGADLSRWSFLTGPVEEVGQVVERYGVGTVRRQGEELQHTLVTMLLDPQGRIAKRYLGLSHSAEELAQGLRALL